MTQEQKQLLDFLEGTGKDIYNRDLESILKTKDMLCFELSHNYIQWLFPLREKSNFAHSIPLTDEMVDYIKSNETILNNIKLSFIKMLEFYGFSYANNEIIPVMSKKEMIIRWMNRGNHNFLRITRILGCLSIVGYDNLAKKWLQVLEELTKDLSYTEDSKVYWRDAVNWR